MEDDAEGSDGLNDIGSGVEESVSPLSAFASAQRSLVSIDFSAIQAAQKALQQSPGLAALVEAQQAIAANFAKSIEVEAFYCAHLDGTVPHEASHCAVDGVRPSLVGLQRCDAKTVHPYRRNSAHGDRTARRVVTVWCRGGSQCFAGVPASLGRAPPL